MDNRPETRPPATASSTLPWASGQRPAMGLMRHWRGMGARFETRLLRPPAVALDEAASVRRQAACAQALRAWCLADSPTLAVASLVATDASPPPDLAAWANAWARQLDGGTRLDALPGRAAGLVWRLRIKLNEARPWRARQPDDPWDAGWAQAGDDSALHLWQGGWQPRRPTLVLAAVADADRLAPALAGLLQRQGQGQLACTVRWLWVGGDGPAVPGPAAQRFTWGPAATPSAGQR